MKKVLLIIGLLTVVLPTRSGSKAPAYEYKILEIMYGGY